jgi:hypothetical protein
MYRIRYTRNGRSDSVLLFSQGQIRAWVAKNGKTCESYSVETIYL